MKQPYFGIIPIALGVQMSEHSCKITAIYSEEWGATFILKQRHVLCIAMFEYFSRNNQTAFLHFTIIQLQIQSNAHDAVGTHWNVD